MFFTAILCNLISSYLIASMGGSLIIAFIAFFALVVLNVEILSLFQAINDLNLLILSIINLFLSIAIFKFKKTKLLKRGFT